jgi:hypothetical protein
VCPLAAPTVVAAMSLSRTKDVPSQAWGRDVILDKITVERDRKGILSARGGECPIDKDLFFQVSDYTQSQPTGPSPGRIYRKALNWPALYPDQYPKRYAINPDPNWFLFLCVKTPDSRPEFDGSVDHVPFHVTFIEES